MKGMPDRLRYLKFVIDPMNSGIVPVESSKQFMLRSKCSRYARESKEGAIVPHKALED